MEYRVIVDKISTKTTVEYCDCEHCKGHYREEVVSFNELVEAASQEEAKKEAIERIYGSREYELTPGKIAKLPFVILAPGEKVLTRKAELELLERWQNGLGLPATPLQVEYSY